MSSTSIHGAIDNFNISDNEISIGGWAFTSHNSQKSQIDSIEITPTNQAASVSFLIRADFESQIPFGFKVSGLSPEDLQNLLNGTSQLIARGKNVEKPIPIWIKIREKLKEAILLHEIKSLNTDSLERITSQLIGQLRAAPQSSSPPTTQSPQLIPVSTGLKSIDQSAIIGHNGNIFLFQGSNHLHQKYFEDPDPRFVSRWEEILKTRNEICREFGVKFLQTIIPEKQSVTPKDYPYEIESPTKFYRLLHEKIAHEAWFVDSLKALKDLAFTNGLPPFMKVDSHFSIFGAQKLINTILRHLDLEPTALPQNFESTYAAGDLGNKFGFGNLLEQSLSCVGPAPELFNHRPVLIHEFNPASGHTGMIRDWENLHAPHDIAVIAFGNSFFERGVRPESLSFWASRLFRRFTFVWTNRLDHKGHDLKMYDVAVCQTIERFLTPPPLN